MRRIGYFTVEEQAAAQHLANQVAASLRFRISSRFANNCSVAEELRGHRPAHLRRRQ